MHFQNVLSSWELQQITDMLFVKEIVYLYLHVTLFRIHVSNTATEKDFDIAIQMPLEHVSSEIQENRNGREKWLLKKTYKCYKARKFLWKNDLAKSSFWN